MTGCKCAAFGANFPSQREMRSRAIMKVTEESHHYSKKSARTDRTYFTGSGLGKANNISAGSNRRRRTLKVIQVMTSKSVKE